QRLTQRNTRLRDCSINHSTTRFPKQTDFAMANIQTLHVAAWTAKNLTDNLVLTRFMLPMNAHDQLVHWCSEKARRGPDMPTSIVVAGLSEILAFFAPETAY